MRSPRGRLGWVLLAGALGAAVVGTRLWSAPDRNTATVLDASTPQAADAGRPALPPLPAHAQPLKEVPCEFTALLAEYRQGHASPAYRRYVREQLRGLVESLSEDVHWRHLSQEQDADVLALLSDTWVLRYALEGQARILERLVDRVRETPDARLRAVLIRSLQQTGEPSTQLLGIQVLKGRDVYRDWVTDAAPEVRAAAVENFREEAARDAGRYRVVAERAVSLATVADDSATAAGLLGASSIEAVRGPAVAQVRTLLQSAQSPDVRAAAARALATSPVAELSASLDALAARYSAEPDASVREALLESISRLGLSRAVPVLERLRDTSAAARDEVAPWLTLLAEQPQRWEVLDTARRSLR
ncbi:HEAT repeat domain-containing protein [Myxococcus sp. AM010]|uniref:HEAT repeat domain-containing protein n=1 Tax=Myxococcus sp. AM010 TaxID=2745138 RepID=UPI0020D19D07|nr:HEAT repeat domain-containing protein [Myxococcus sp. AM010]